MPAEMVIAKNPLSKNLSKIFGNRFTDEFKKNVKELQEKLEEKNLMSKGKRNTFSEMGVRNWLSAQKKNETKPHKYPSLSNLEKIAIVKGMSLWDLFIDKSQYIDLSKWAEEKRKLINIIIDLKMEYIKDLLNLAQILYKIQGEKEKINGNNFINLFDK